MTELVRRSGMVETPGGPTAMAAHLEDKITELNAQREVATSRAERSSLNKHLHSCKDLLAWCKTRAGYRGPG